jgi:hypothetical protein
MPHHQIPLILRPSRAKLLNILLLVTPALDLFVLSLLYAAHLPTAICFLSLTPTLVVFIRLVNPTPVLVIDDQRVRFCGLSNIRRSVPRAQLIALTPPQTRWRFPVPIYEATHIEVSYQSLDQRRGVKQRQLSISGFLLRMPADVLLLALKHTPGYEDLIAFRPDIDDIAVQDLIARKETLAGLSWPWVWSPRALWQGCATGLTIASYFALVTHLLIANGLVHPSERSIIWFEQVPSVIWPIIAGFWLTRLTRGNKVPAMIATGVGGYGMAATIAVAFPIGLSATLPGTLLVVFLFGIVLFPVTLAWTWATSSVARNASFTSQAEQLRQQDVQQQIEQQYINVN